MLLFDLLPGVPENANRYRFASVAVKEPKFEIDGVFLPPEDQPGVVYYAEVQFQRDERLYERVVSESAFDDRTAEEGSGGCTIFVRTIEQ